jgi:hypothetical protein
VKPPVMAYNSPRVPIGLLATLLRALELLPQP